MVPATQELQANAVVDSEDSGRNSSSNSGSGVSATGDSSNSDACLLEVLPLSCWSMVVAQLSARDLLRLSIASKSMQQLLATVPGLWVQACCLCLQWPNFDSTVASTGCTTAAIITDSGSRSSITHSAGSSASMSLVPMANSRQAGYAGYQAAGSSYSTGISCVRSSAAAAAAATAAALSGQRTPATGTQQAASATAMDDQVACSILLSFTAVAHTVQGLGQQLRPQTYPLPPWLGAQPGKARGFVRFSCDSLDPPLLLSEAQVHHLSLGCLSDYAGGVFTSSYTSNSRRNRPCGCMAAVVVNRTLLAELYLPASSPPVEHWHGLLTLPGMYTADSSSNSWHSTAPESTDDTGVDAADVVGNSEAGDAACIVQSHVAADVELWLNAAAIADLSEAKTAAVGHVSAQSLHSTSNRVGVGNSLNSSSKAGRNSGRSRQSSISWSDLHNMVISCISSNASRCKAVRGTAVIPPGTAAANDLEHGLAKLAASGAPVLDLRRLQYSSFAATSHCSNDAGPSWNGVSSAGRGASSSSRGMLAAAQQWATVLQSVQAELTSTLRLSAANNAVQHTPATQGTTTASGWQPDDDMCAEALAEVVQQLPCVAPNVQLLVLPIILPDGTVGKRVPGSVGTKLSAPRLLSLNVPFLVPVRHLWDRLPWLRQVLLMAGQPVPLHDIPAVQTPRQWPQQQAVWQPQQGTQQRHGQHQQQQVRQWEKQQQQQTEVDSQQCLLVQHMHNLAVQISGVTTSGGACQPSSSHSTGGTAVAATPLAARKGILQGVFSQKDLEEQWQQQAQQPQQWQQQPQHAYGISQWQQLRQQLAQQQQWGQADEEAWFIAQQTDQEQHHQQHQQPQHDRQGVVELGTAASPYGAQLQHLAGVEQCQQQGVAAAVTAASAYDSPMSSYSRRDGTTSSVYRWAADSLPAAVVEAVQGMVLSCMDRSVGT